MTTDRTPYCHKIRYGITGAPILTEDEMDGSHAPGIGVSPTLIELVYSAARDGKPASVSASVTGSWTRFGEPADGQVATHFKNGPDGWPAWLVEEARLHDPAVSSSGRAALLHETADAGLRDRIAEALIAWTYRGKDPEHGGILETVRANAYSRTEAVMAVLQTATLRELELLHRPNTTPSRPEPRRVAADRAAEVERLQEQLEEAEDTAEQLVRNVQTVARERESYRKAWKDEQQRRAKAEAELRRVADEEQPAETQGATTGDKAAALGMTPREYRAASHRAAEEQIREAVQGLYAEVGFRVLDALDARPVVGEQPDTHAPLRGDAVEAWLKAQRDRDSRDTVRWEVLDDALDAYRLHADTGTPLSEHVCEGDGCDCLEQPDTEATDAPPREPHPTQADMDHALTVWARFRGQDADAPDTREQPDTQTREADLTERLERGRTQLIEAMSAVSEDRTCCGWASDWARTLHAEGGIWETLGRAVGWPTGSYDQWVWVSWGEAAALYTTEAPQ